MIELPEAVVLSDQIARALTGKRIRDATVLASPHKLAWFHGDPREYPDRLRGKKVSGAEPRGGMVRIRLGRTLLVFQEGPVLRYVTDPSAVPDKHQLLLEFADSSFLFVTIRMYGGIVCFQGKEPDDDYYRAAREKPSPLGRDFTRAHFHGLRDVPRFERLSAKAFLATEQRVPGLGNGVLQDILFNAGIHPKRKMGSVTDSELDALYASVRGTLRAMVEGGGRDTETDLFGQAGGYRTILSRKTSGTPCPGCGDPISKAAFAGGSVYFCARCQPAR